MIFFLYFLIFLITFLGVLVFYPYTVYFTGDINKYFLMCDFFIVDLLFRKNKKKTVLKLKLFGLFIIFEKKTGKNKVKKYDPDYERIYFVISFFIRHILSLLKIVDIKKLGVEIKIGFREYYILSQIHIFSIIFNNILPDGIFCVIEPDYEKELFDYQGKGEITIYLWKIFWFFIKLLFHRATWSGIYEYYRYYKKI
ncbi:MAG: hypothetical protein M0R46_04370 [Candidatus Muirbacterium halophilum]|nr:hypothetical protein [Candidatus Muirbacterium halophilum]MCK9475129.1 hypothetical protein [Candidatus Muirbacterium halophilum]